MNIRFNYYLKVKNILGKDFDVFEVQEPTSLRNMILSKIPEDKIKQIDLSELLIICEGRNIENLDDIIEKDTVFSICPKIYGG